MAVDLDDPPIYDPISKSGEYVSEIWIGWFATLLQSLAEYLTQNGMFVPRLTTDQRDAIPSPGEGQMIYNSTLLAPQIWQDGQWRTFTTTP